MRRILAVLAVASSSCNTLELREPLEPPRRVRATAGIGSVTLEWEPVPSASAYRIYYAADRSVGPDTWEALAGAAVGADRSPFTIGNLPPNQELFFAISSLRGTSEAKPATSVAATPLAGPLVQATPAWSPVGPALSLYGTNLATGDLNGDGHADIVVSTPFAFTDTGYIEVWYGRDAMQAVPDVSMSFVAGAQTGWAIAVADMNGDGYDDLLESEPGDDAANGHVHIAYGGPDGIDTMDVTIAGSNGERMGESFAVGDENGDGWMDLLVGAKGPSGVNGAVYLFLGGPTGFPTAPNWTLAAESPGDGLGSAVVLADFDADGHDDVVVGEPDWSGTAGRVRVLFGSATVPATTAGVTFNGAAGYRFGASLVNLGDVNGGGEDVAIGELTVVDSTPPSITVISDVYGIVGQLDGTSGPAGSRLVAAGGDFNRDGWSDVVIGDPNAGGGRGSVSLFRGGYETSITPDWTVSGAAAGDGLGAAVAVLPDVNGDGLHDIAATAPAAQSNAGVAYYWRGGAPRGITVDAGLPLLDWDDSNETPLAASFTDPVPGGPWVCEWEWFDFEVENPIDPCTPGNAGSVQHTRETNDPATGWGRLRVRNAIDGRYGEAIVPMVQGER